LSLVSVILPFHRRDQFLTQAISSVLESTKVRLELILIDDSPDFADQDSRPTWVKNDRVKLVRTPGAIGYGKSLQLAGDHVSGQYVALMNSDDLITPNRFIEQMRKLERSELCITNMVKIDLRGKRKPFLLGEVPPSLYDSTFLLLGSYGANATWMCHTDWWKTWAFFDDYSALDWRIALSSFYESSVSYLSEVHYFYRVHNEQVTRKDGFFKDSRIVFDAWRKHLARYKGDLFSKQIFDVFAAPFTNALAYDWDEIGEWINTYPKLFSHLTTKQLKLFSYLVNRRLLLLMRNPQNVRIKSLRYLPKSFSSAPGLGFDIIRSLG
jgi:glycosyltransferase involved in cell wall biosynthesis